jgi:hypothetical protein
MPDVVLYFDASLRGGLNNPINVNLYPDDRLRGAQSSASIYPPYTQSNTVFTISSTVVTVGEHDESYQGIIVRTETAAAILFLIDCTMDWGAAGRPG